MTGGWDVAKWVLWAPWVAAIVVFAVRAGGFHAIQPRYGVQRGVSLLEPD